MEITRIHIEGLCLIRPRVFEDDRGYFFESYNRKILSALGIDADFVQDNESCSARNVLRGLHYQVPPYAQGKLVRVIRGAVLDVAVDLRKNSPTFGQWHSVILSGENKLLYWIPEGFAHGFLTLEDDTIFFYKCTQFYHREAERSIRWNDPILAIHWGDNVDPVLSEKDRLAPLFSEIESPF